MDRIKVLVRDHYREYLKGQEVRGAAILPRVSHRLRPGDKVIVYHDTIAASTSLAVPQEKIHQSIGVEGMVTELDPQVLESTGGKHVQWLKVKKI